MNRALVGLLFAASSLVAAQSQSPQPEFTFDIKPYGFVVDNAIQNNTTLGFASDDKIGVHVDQCQIPTRCKNSLLIIGLPERKVLNSIADFPYPVRFLPDGKFLYFTPGQVDLYSFDLQPIKSYPSSTLPHLDFAARARLVHLAPDGLSISIPIDQESEILSTMDLVPRQRVHGEIVALGTGRWFMKTRSSPVIDEQVYSSDKVTNFRQIRWKECAADPFYLNLQLVLLRNCHSKLEMRDDNDRLRYAIKSRTGDMEILPDFAGDRFVTELYIEKTVDWSGTAQYQTILLRVFETESGKEIFHMEDHPSENEPTWSHYIALSPSGKRLAVIRNGVLRIYDLKP
jgi:hypothetical protein